MEYAEKTKYIFDLDGTLYSFENEASGTFSASRFNIDLRRRVNDYIAQRLDVSIADAETIVKNIDDEYDGELSIGFEERFNIDRYDYYSSTWNCLPENYIAPNSNLVDMLSEFRGNALLLTAAPNIWASTVLQYLGIADIFGENVMTGEPDIRKPNKIVFEQAARRLDAEPSQIISIGDQNYSDIVPARALGMTTILIGPDKLDADYRVDSIVEAINLIKEKL